MNEEDDKIFNDFMTYMIVTGEFDKKDEPDEEEDDDEYDDDEDDDEDEQDEEDDYYYEPTTSSNSYITPRQQQSYTPPPSVQSMRLKDFSPRERQQLIAMYIVRYTILAILLFLMILGFIVGGK
ncbi:MAG: hypothetical protein LBN99_07690 [Oscillospiraceae bacterium]|jgi:hypothetical protein|nr:hypothetical protein [Oscillospiraceae bacterium]